MKKILATGLVMMMFTPILVKAVEIPERGYVSASAEANEEYAPNVAKITLSVQNSDKDIKKATELNKKNSETSMEAVKKLLDTTKGETIKTTGFNVTPEYSYKNNVRTFVQYNATNSYEVKIKDVAKLGKIISAALDNGANSVSGLDFDLDSNDAVCNSLIVKAIGQAKTRANAIAGGLGTSITGVKSFNAQCSTNNYYQPRYNMMMKTEAAADAVGSSPVPTEPGTIKLRANVDGQFFVK